MSPAIPNTPPHPHTTPPGALHTPPTRSVAKPHPTPHPTPHRTHHPIGALTQGFNAFVKTDAFQYEMNITKVQPTTPMGKAWMRAAPWTYLVYTGAHSPHYVLCNFLTDILKKQEALRQPLKEEINLSISEITSLFTPDPKQVCEQVGTVCGYLCEYVRMSQGCKVMDSSQPSHTLHSISVHTPSLSSLTGIGEAEAMHEICCGGDDAQPVGEIDKFGGARLGS